MSGVESLLLGPLLESAGEASSGLYKLIKKLRHAPKEFEDLLAEVNRFRAFLDHLQNASTTANSRPFPVALTTVVADIKQKLLEIDQMVAYELTTASEEGSVNRTAWARKSVRAKALMDHLRRLREEANSIVGVMNLWVAFTILAIVIRGSTQGLSSRCSFLTDQGVDSAWPTLYLLLALC